MAKKKGHKTYQVPPPKSDPNKIVIEIGAPKFRAPKMPKGGRHHTREDDVRKGRSRKPKHKGRAE